MDTFEYQRPVKRRAQAWIRQLTSMPEFDAILFDFDGVLADTEPVHWACWAEVLKPLGITLEWDYYRDHGIGIDDKEMLRVLAGLANPPRDWRTLFAEYPRKKELFRRRVLAHPPFDPALDAFSKSAPQLQLAVVTSSARGEIDPLLMAGGLRHHFDALVGAEDVRHYKPDPEPYRKARSCWARARRWWWKIPLPVWPAGAPPVLRCSP